MTRIKQAVLSGVALVAQIVSAADLTLTLPRSVRSGDTLWLEVSLGRVPRGTELDVMTKAGRFLGVISPTGIRQGQDAGIYTLPLPLDALTNDQLPLRLSLRLPGQKERDYTSEEVKRIALKLVEAKK